MVRKMPVFLLFVTHTVAMVLSISLNDSGSLFQGGAPLSRSRGKGDQQVMVVTGGAVSPSVPTKSVETITAPGSDPKCRVADLPQPRFSHVSFELEGKLVVCGGSLKTTTAGFTDTCIAYDNRSGKWMRHSKLIMPKRYGSSFVYITGLPCIMGGYDGATRTIECYNKGKWQLRNEKIPGTVKNSCAINFGSNQVLVTGSALGDGKQILERESDGTWVGSYDKQWPELHQEVYGHACTRIGDKMLIIGGRRYVPRTFYKDAFFIDLTAKTVSPQPKRNLMEPRAFFHIGQAWDHIFAISGSDGTKRIPTIVESSANDVEWTDSGYPFTNEGIEGFGLAVVPSNIIGC